MTEIERINEIDELNFQAERTRAATAKLQAETAKLQAEAEKLQAEAEKLDAEAHKLRAEREKLMHEQMKKLVAESGQIGRWEAWSVPVGMATLIAVVAATAAKVWLT